MCGSEGPEWTPAPGSGSLPDRMHAFRSTRMQLCLLALVGLLASACGAAGGAEARRVQRPDVEVKPTPEPIVAPLTGERAFAPQDWQDRPALSLKVENTAASRPQAGLGEADVVYEELAEGGVTRFVAVFHSESPEDVGPIRSARSVDPDLLAPIGGLFGYSGGIPEIVASIRRVQGVTDVGFDRAADAYDRRSGREAPHNLFTSPEALWDGREGDPPPELFTFLDPDASSGEAGEEADEVRMSFAGNGELIRYVYDDDDGVYRRFHRSVPHETEDGTHIGAANVVVQYVQVTESDIVDAAGLVSPNVDVLGSGDAILFRDGRAVEGRWERPSYGEPTRFTDADGDPMRFARGPTWVELVPRGRDVDF